MAGGRDVSSLISKSGRGRPPALELVVDVELSGLRGGTRAARGASSSDESVSESSDFALACAAGADFDWKLALLGAVADFRGAPTGLRETGLLI